MKQLNSLNNMDTELTNKKKLMMAYMCQVASMHFLQQLIKNEMQEFRPNFEALMQRFPRCGDKVQLVIDRMMEMIVERSKSTFVDGVFTPNPKYAFGFFTAIVNTMLSLKQSEAQLATLLKEESNEQNN